MQLQSFAGEQLGVSRVVGAGGDRLRCVWSSHPDHTRDCRACIPLDVVTSAWRREGQEHGTPEGFFYFSWNGGVWLAYGLRDGRVRGVYCPTHCAQRTEKSLWRRAALSRGPGSPRLPERPPAGFPPVALVDAWAS